MNDDELKDYQNLQDQFWWSQENQDEQWIEDQTDGT